jgi:hypothetical protein
MDWTRLEASLIAAAMAMAMVVASFSDAVLHPLAS